jgi:HSP20 family molecular chaperone IbpA
MVKMRNRSNLPTFYNRDSLINDLLNPVDCLFTSALTDFFSDWKPKNLMDKSLSRIYPKTDVKRVGGNLVFEAAVPFLEKDNLNITLDKNYLVIEGEIVNDVENDTEYYSRELSRKSFKRAWYLDESLYEQWKQKHNNQESEMVSAALKDGLLVVTLNNFLEPVPEERGSPQVETKKTIPIE